MLARVTALLSVLWFSASGAILILSQNGKPGYAIVIGAEASPAERHAAKCENRVSLAPIMACADAPRIR